MQPSKEWRIENILMILLSISSVYICVNVVRFVRSSEFLSYLSSGEFSIFHGSIFVILFDLTIIGIFFTSFFLFSYLRFKAILQDYVINQRKKFLLCDLFFIFSLINLAFFIVCIINVISRI